MTAIPNYPSKKTNKIDKAKESDQTRDIQKIRWRKWKANTNIKQIQAGDRVKWETSRPDMVVGGNWDESNPENGQLW